MMVSLLKVEVADLRILAGWETWFLVFLVDGAGLQGTGSGSTGFLGPVCLMRAIVMIGSRMRWVVGLDLRLEAMQESAIWGSEW